MLALQIRCGLCHSVHVRLKVQPGDVAALKDWFSIAHIAGVGISLSHRIVAGVKTLGGLPHVDDADIVGQIAVQIVLNLRRGEGSVQPHTGGHGLCVHARVGASRADDIGNLFHFTHSLKHGFYFSLNGVFAWLVFPAEISGAVIGNDKLVIFHRFDCSRILKKSLLTNQNVVLK